ncbi:hypothetical protein [Deinococcus aerolatus]|uniref:hypothetical protein n=1 Tax=Deinococcus aerolatus TaxID=522487 RepID=UPI00166406D8|nr:hypothetical protein [Deinococcus aerolatus]
MVLKAQSAQLAVQVERGGLADGGQDFVQHFQSISSAKDAVGGQHVHQLPVDFRHETLASAAGDNGVDSSAGDHAALAVRGLVFSNLIGGPMLPDTV